MPGPGGVDEAGVYGALVTDAGWSPARFEGWLADTLVFQLLRG
jgi:hypothetical protein